MATLELELFSTQVEQYFPQHYDVSYMTKSYGKILRIKINNFHRIKLNVQYNYLKFLARKTLFLLIEFFTILKFFKILKTI